jgi:GNAT superfamily N-acetyltransferase
MVDRSTEIASMNLTCETVGPEGLPVVSEILLEAAAWLESIRSPLWKASDLTPVSLKVEVEQGLFFLARCDGEDAGVFSLQEEDEIYWSDADHQGTLYLHKLAVRRNFAKRGVSSFMLEQAIQFARDRGKKFLRLDCDAHRPELNRLYRDFGFTYVDEVRLKGYTGSRYQIEVS